MKKLIFLVLSILLYGACNTNKNSNVNATASFKVWGNCDMCKETIESSIEVDGVSKAEWSPETKQIEVYYDSTEISLDAIQKRIANVGYDNDNYKGNDKAYSELNECCQYERRP